MECCEAGQDSLGLSGAAVGRRGKLLRQAMSGMICQLLQQLRTRSGLLLNFRHHAMSFARLALFNPLNVFGSYLLLHLERMRYGEIKFPKYHNPWWQSRCHRQLAHM